MKIKDIGSLRPVRVSPAELDRRLGELGERLRRRHGRFIREPIPSGSLTLDRATGLGGLPRGHIVSLTGTERGNREMLTAAVAETQKRGGVVAVVDAGGGLGRRLTGRSEIETRELLITRPQGEVAAIDLACTLVESAAADLLVLPVPAPRDQDESEAVLRALRRLGAAVKGSSTCVVLVDRAAPATRRAAKLSLDDLRRLADLGLETRSGARTPAGRRIMLDLDFGSPSHTESGRSASLEIERGGGLSRVGDLLDGATAEDLIERRGSVYRYGDLLLGRGRESSKRTLADRPEVALEIESMLERATAEIRRRAAAATELERSEVGAPGRPYYPIEPPTEPTEPINTAHTDLPGGGQSSGPDLDPTLERELAEAAMASRERRRRAALDLREDSAAPRFVNTWFESDEEPVLPLIVGRKTRLFLQIGYRRDDDPGSSTTPFAEPDWGGHDHLDLLVSLYSAELSIEPRQQRLLLPRLGESGTLEFTVTPRAAGACRIRIVVSLARELEILQRLSLEVEAVTAPAAAGAEAG